MNEVFSVPGKYFTNEYLDIDFCVQYENFIWKREIITVVYNLHSLFNVINFACSLKYRETKLSKTLNQQVYLRSFSASKRHLRVNFDQVHTQDFVWGCWFGSRMIDKKKTVLHHF